jgi:hypothetical protein
MTQQPHEVATDLAREHREQDPDTYKILFRFDHDDEEIQLVEVSRSVAKSGEAFPVRFNPQPDEGLPFTTVIVLLHPDEWRALDRGDLPLPDSVGPLDEFSEIELD